MKPTCSICERPAEGQFHLCKERMFGWGDAFEYFQCAGCGCLQITAVPEDLGRFYPPQYYSFFAVPLPRTGWRSWLGAQRDWLATRAGVAGRVVRRFSSVSSALVSLAAVSVSKEARILDVGCGRGQLLSALHRAGFRRLAGIDPFLPEDVEVAPGVSVRKRSLEQVEETFDLIMLHHVFEHLPWGEKTLRHCQERLSPHGKVLLRFPVADSEAWEQYQECWVQLDAPRHLFLHTRSSFELLAKKAGLKIEKWFCDSTAFQFWGSELYRKGQPLFDRSGAATRPESFFDPSEMEAFAGRAREVNAAGRGDQVVTILSAG
jgi:SAM-dependent methyltransferase